jgi:hypothetical protein
LCDNASFSFLFQKYKTITYAIQIHYLILFPLTVMLFVRAVWRGEQSWLAFRSGYNGGNHDNRVGVRGHLQTRYPVNRTDRGWQIQGPTQKFSVNLLFDFGQLLTEPWEFGGPVTKLIYKDLYDRVHSIQPVLFSFEDTPFSYKLDADGFSLEIEGKTYDFKYVNGELGFDHEGSAY